MLDNQGWTSRNIAILSIPRPKASPLYFCGSILIFPIWSYNGLGNINDLIWSCLLLIPAIFGQKIGEGVQDKISNETFKKIILYTLLIIGISLFIKNL